MKIKNKLGLLLTSITFAMFAPTQASAFGWGFTSWILPVVTPVITTNTNTCDNDCNDTCDNDCNNTYNYNNSCNITLPNIWSLCNFNVSSYFNHGRHHRHHGRHHRHHRGC